MSAEDVIREAVKAEMTKQGTTVAQLSKHTNLSTALIDRMLEGKRRGTLSTWETLMDALQVKLRATPPPEPVHHENGRPPSYRPREVTAEMLTRRPDYVTKTEFSAYQTSMYEKLQLLETRLSTTNRFVSAHTHKVAMPTTGPIPLSKDS